MLEGVVSQLQDPSIILQTASVQTLAKRLQRFINKHGKTINLLLQLSIEKGRPTTTNALESKNSIFKPCSRIAKFFPCLEGCESFFAGVALMENFDLKTRGIHRHTSAMQRGNSDRPKHEIISVRYQITAVARQEEALAKHKKTLGWRAYVTNALAEQLNLEQAVLTYRDEWIIEHGFHRLKGVPLSLNPLFVKRDDQVIDLTNLLSIAVRMLTLIEFVVRRKLTQNQEKLTGLIENNPKKGIDNPTTERLLKAFQEINLTIVHLPDRIVRHVTPLSDLQTRILELLGLSPTIYTRLAQN